MIKYKIMIKTFFKHLIYSLFDAKYLSKDKSFLYFFKFFFIRFFYAFNFIRNLQKCKKIMKNIPSSKYFSTKATNIKIVNDLDNYGFNSDLILKKKELNLLKNEISLKNSELAFKDKNQNHNSYSNLKIDSKLDDIVKASKKGKIPHTVLNINLSKTKILKKIALSNFFKNIAKDYLNSENISIYSQFFISNPFKNNKQSKKDNAQYFHSDLDFRKFFKVFIYFNRVDKNSGPHVFVKYTHKKKKFKHILAERLDDNEIIKSYGKQNIITFVKKSGSIIFEDTYGLHKGDYPKTKNRIMLVLIYGKSSGTEYFKNRELIT